MLATILAQVILLLMDSIIVFPRSNQLMWIFLATTQHFNSSQLIILMLRKYVKRVLKYPQ